MVDHTYQDLETSDETREKYSYFMRVDPDMRDILGPIERIDDPVTGREMRVRDGRVALMRGSENLHPVKLYLDPFPHIRQDKGQDLRGWYQGKLDTPKGGRERPCMTDATLTQPYGGYCPVGCGFCLVPGELVDTAWGPRPIEDVKRGDLVWGRSAAGTVLASVLDVARHWKPEGYVSLELDDGRVLKLTGDHPVYSATRNKWVVAQKLRRGEELENIRFGGDGTTRQDRVGKRALSKLSQGGAKECRDAQADERSSTCSAREHVEESIRPQEPTMARGHGREGQAGQDWVQNVEAFCVHGQAGARTPDEVGMGSADCCVAGQEGLLVGVRATGDQAAVWQGVHPRLPTEGRTLPGGQRLGAAARQEYFEGDACARAADTIAEPESAQASRNPRVTKVTRVDGGLYVHDIETTAENFYQRGVLVHNCYINSGFRGYRGSGLVTVPLGYGEQVARQLRSMQTSSAGYFSSFTDPFLPLEDYYHNTQGGATAFADEGLPVFFLSRLAYPGWAYDLLERNRYSYAQKSINTPDPDDWKKLSPGALPLMQHMEEIRELRRRGIYVSIQVNPIIAGIVTHDDVEQLFEMLAKAGANHVIVKFVEANHPWAPAMVDRITKRFGANRAAHFRDLFTENSCGGQKTVTEEYRREGHTRYRDRATRLGMTYSLCYEYTKVTGEWHSMGPEFITSDQCHGHRVPVHRRVSPGSPFTEIEACPPSGCLSCADTNGGEARCGSKMMGEARALVLRELRQPWAQ